jgi:hypothetical protein
VGGRGKANTGGLSRDVGDVIMRDHVRAGPLGGLAFEASTERLPALSFSRDATNCSLPGR